MAQGRSFPAVRPVWPSLAQSLGVTGYKATSVEEFKKALSISLAEEGPSLIEVMV